MKSATVTVLAILERGRGLHGTNHFNLFGLITRSLLQYKA